MSSALQQSTLRGKEDIGGGLFRVTLEPSPGASESYVRPGQYVVLRADGKTAYFVLAGDVGGATWDLVLRPSGTVALAVLAASVGEPLEVSAAQGTGFPVEEAEGRPLMVVVTGSGIAAARPVLRARIRAAESKTSELFLGVRTVADIPLEDELREWSQAGVGVTVCLSRETVPPGRPGFAAGYVQDVARAHAGRLAAGAPPGRRMIFAAGVKEMIAAIRALAADLGAVESDVRTNY
jgi:NAD(P)H-flavin reductase